MLISHFADTGFFIALLDQQDSLHSRAAAWARATREPVAVTEYVLVETLNALAGSPARGAAAELGDRVRQHSQSYLFVPASPTLYERGLALYREKPDKHWSLTDCTSFVVMRDRGITTAFAYDRHFEQAGFRALLREDPPGDAIAAGA